MRHLVEAELLSSIQWPAKEAIAELRARVQELEKLIDEGKRAEWAVRHRDFHRAIFNLSPHKILVREVLRLWTLTDLVYIPLLGLDEIDFYAKVIVNAFLAIGLALSGRRAGIL